RGVDGAAELVVLEREHIGAAAGFSIARHALARIDLGVDLDIDLHVGVDILERRDDGVAVFLVLDPEGQGRLAGGALLFHYVAPAGLVPLEAAVRPPPGGGLRDDARARGRR